MSTSPARPLPEAERHYRLRLIRSENIGPITFRRLLDRFGSATAALRALPELARRGGRRDGVRIYPAEAADTEFRAHAAIGAQLIVFGDADYPPRLAAIEDAPAAFSARGDVSLLTRPTLGIVGSRNASLNGRSLAATLARDLGTFGFVVVSGLARGIDTAAHAAALPTGTIAVLANGADVCYPPENRELYEGIVERGLVIAEPRLGATPQARQFPRRNRLISGLSQGVVVVEASHRSGSLITARLALEQGRDVFAVPGSPLDPRARGCNDLLRQGAILTEHAADVLAVLRGAAASLHVASPPQPPVERLSEFTDGDDATRSVVAEMLSPVPVAVDEIIRSCQLSPAVVSTILLEWELAGRVERLPGNRVSLIA